ncbi:hypothetical protein ACVFI8_14805 [Agarivorans sp. MS3-6]
MNVGLRPWLLLLAASLLMAAKPNLGAFRSPQICQAAIASLQGVKANQVKLYRNLKEGWQFSLDHLGKTDSYFCQLQADTVLWRRSQDSRWQHSPSIRYQFNSSARQLFIRHYLGEAQLAEFSFRSNDF